MVGFGQLLLVLLIVFALFGAGKLPSVMGELGKGIRNFRKGLKGEEVEVSSEEDKISEKDKK
ncbi:twin-arginine translocase TatA/TatE family subunit [Rickettsiales bacterium]|nr:twin-arginine translocase TatA/TatE family subunit [Rickettsiales bacterium]